MDGPADTSSGTASRRLIGAKSGEVLVADTLTILIAKLMGAALEQRPDRHVVITDAANFHSDLYIIEAMARARRSTDHREDHRSQHAGRGTGRRRGVGRVDPRRLSHGRDARPRGHHPTSARAGALMLWDFAHSTGAVPLDVEGADVDFAAGCGYKYLNGGPGSPAFLYVRYHVAGAGAESAAGMARARSTLRLRVTFEAAKGIRAFMTSSPSIVALAALDGALDVFDRTLDDRGAREEPGA